MLYFFVSGGGGSFQSPSTVFKGHILTTGHLAQPAARAIGHSVTRHLLVPGGMAETEYTVRRAGAPVSTAPVVATRTSDSIPMPIETG